MTQTSGSSEPRRAGGDQQPAGEREDQLAAAELRDGDLVEGDDQHRADHGAGDRAPPADDRQVLLGSTERLKERSSIGVQTIAAGPDDNAALLSVSSVNAHPPLQTKRGAPIIRVWRRARRRRPIPSMGSMINAHIDISQGLDGEAVVLACFDLGDELLAASSHAVAAASAERFRTAEMTVDGVLELRELTALADELAGLAERPGMRTVVLRPARLAVYRDAVARFVETRDEADWIREEDREPLSRVRGMLDTLEALCGDALRVALAGPSATRPC